MEIPAMQAALQQQQRQLAAAVGEIERLQQQLPQQQPQPQPPPPQQGEELEEEGEEDGGEEAEVEDGDEGGEAAEEAGGAIIHIMVGHIHNHAAHLSYI